MLPAFNDNPEEYSRVCESEYEAGDKTALMRIVVCCACNKSPIPEWATDILINTYGYAFWGEVASWDLVFGKPSRRRKNVSRKWMRKDEVFWKIVLSKEKGRVIDDKLFEEVGRELGIGGKTEVKRMYAAVRAEMAFQRRK